MYKRLSMAALAVAFTLASVAAVASEWPWQRKPQKAEASPGASVMQVIGANTMVTITYHRPGVKGREVWDQTSDNPNIGRIVPRDGDPRPWRAGANEATTIEVSHDVLVDGNELPAGKYALFLIPTDDHWTVVINSQAEQWGSFRYDQAQDVLRADVQPEETEHTEWLRYGFDELSEDSARAYLAWEEVKVPFTISLPAESAE